MSEQFGQLTNFLKEFEPLWRERPFTTRNLRWEGHYPHLRPALLSLDQETLEAAELDIELLKSAVPGLADIIGQGQELSIVPRLAGQSKGDDGPSLRTIREVKHRKQKQIVAFLEGLGGLGIPLGGTWIEWCAGKGHLGRGLIDCGATNVIALERQKELVQKGRSLAAKYGYNQMFFESDVLHDTPPSPIADADGIVGLHACGSLTDKLLSTMMHHDLQFAVAAPCCYHAGVGNQKKHWSSHGQSAGINLSGEELRLVTAEIVVARPKLRRQRVQEMAWRLSLDRWVRESGEIEEYTRQGKFPGHWFSWDFETFMEAGCSKLHVPSPSPGKGKALREWGVMRAHEVRALGLVRSVFRRPLETWINLDRVIGLQEAGLRAKLLTFCERDSTPRNQLIFAENR